MYKVQNQRKAIINDFNCMGFRGRTAFYNVCKSIDVRLSGFALIEFYSGVKICENLTEKLETIIEILRYE